MVDQWEDEGFQSASNLTPDSQSEPSMTPDLDLWEAVLTYEASKRRSWERIGWYVTLSLPLNALCLCPMSTASFETPGSCLWKHQC